MKKFIFDVETTGFYPLSDRIICISLMECDSDISISFYGENEFEILSQFINAIKSSDELIGFNNDNFDIPFIVKRCLINGVNIGKLLKMHLIDLRKIINCYQLNYNEYEKGKLSDWAPICNHIITTENGEKMKEFYLAKDWEKIKSHCEEDVIITTALYKRCKFCGLI